MTTFRHSTFSETAAAISMMSRAERQDRAWAASRELAGRRLSMRFLLAYIAVFGRLGPSGVSEVDPGTLAIDCGIPAGAVDDVLGELERLGLLMVAAAKGRRRRITFPSFVRRPVADGALQQARHRQTSSAAESQLQH